MEKGRLLGKRVPPEAQPTGLGFGLLAMDQALAQRGKCATSLLDV